MESMRNLRTSLPSAARRQASQPPEELMQAFKQAALSVTTLYKTAASEQARGYQEGYQDALEELLRFLDKENLGLQDGEGWRVRQWATERYQVSDHQHDNEEEAEDDARARSSSPVSQRKDIPESATPQSHAEHVTSNNIVPRSESAPPIGAVGNSESLPRQTMTTFTIPASEFTFQSMVQPQMTNEMEMSGAEHNASGPENSPSHVQINLRARQSRSTRRDTRALNSRLGPGAGAKRSFPAIDFFDFSGFNGRDGRDNFNGGGKRGRLA